MGPWNPVGIFSVTIKHSYKSKIGHIISVYSSVINVMRDPKNDVRISAQLLKAIIVFQDLWNAAGDVLTHAGALSEDAFCVVSKADVGGFEVKCL